MAYSFFVLFVLFPNRDWAIQQGLRYSTQAAQGKGVTRSGLRWSVNSVVRLSACDSSALVWSGVAALLAPVARRSRSVNLVLTLVAASARSMNRGQIDPQPTLVPFPLLICGSPCIVQNMCWLRRRPCGACPMASKTVLDCVQSLLRDTSPNPPT